MIKNGVNIHIWNDFAIGCFEEYENLKFVKFLIKCDPIYFSKNEIAKYHVVKYNLYEFYDIFNIKSRDKFYYGVFIPYQFEILIISSAIISFIILPIFIKIMISLDFIN